ncbi:MAG: Npt1/Npt2 family nucleotide transporter [Vicinamibacterales bacterium]|nr:Npt1/Npt2 family nucleotide transporter [Vicinamibacterales bacterium]
MLPSLLKRHLLDCFDIRRREWPFTLAMLAYFFLIIASFWILKPIKKSVFVEYYAVGGFDLGPWIMSAAQAELLAKVLNMVVAMGAVVLFSWLATRFRRQQLTYVFSGLFMAAFLVYMPAVVAPSGFTVWSFYLFGDLYSTLMVATFFAFLNDSVTPWTAKRLYGVVGFGGVLGGVAGSTLVAARLAQQTTVAWLWVVFGAGALTALAAFIAARWSHALPRGPVPVAATPRAEPRAAAPAHPALAGARLTFRSSYLLAIAAIVGLYELASTVLDFMFTSTVVHYLDGPAIGQHFALVYSLTNWVAMFVQLLATSMILRKFGMVTALLVLPAAMLGGATAFAVFPVLWVGSLLNTADNGFSYSLNQSAREALYVPTTPDEKYTAKAFIDMFVQRFAKALAVGLSLAITLVFTNFEDLRWLAGLVVVIIAVWFLAARHAGRHFQAVEAQAPDTPGAKDRCGAAA